MHGSIIDQASTPSPSFRPRTKLAGFVDCTHRKMLNVEASRESRSLIRPSESKSFAMETCAFPPTLTTHTLRHEPCYFMRFLQHKSTFVAFACSLHWNYAGYLTCSHHLSPTLAVQLYICKMVSGGSTATCKGNCHNSTNGDQRTPSRSKASGTLTFPLRNRRGLG